MGSLLSKPTENEVENPVGSKTQIRIAVAGDSGVGKSAFINAIRGYELLIQIVAICSCVWMHVIPCEKVSARQFAKCVHSKCPNK